MKEIMIGVVKNGNIEIFFPKPALPGNVRLTSISMQEARPPESGEINLTEYEGNAIAVQGRDGGGWIYEASVIDTGGPIVTALVQNTFGQTIEVT